MLLPAGPTPTSLAQEARAPALPLAIEVNCALFVAPIGNPSYGNVRSTSLSSALARPKSGGRDGLRGEAFLGLDFLLLFDQAKSKSR
jgi:hypothetical protein